MLCLHLGYIFPCFHMNGDEIPSIGAQMSFEKVFMYSLFQTEKKNPKIYLRLDFTTSTFSIMISCPCISIHIDIERCDC